MRELITIPTLGPKKAMALYEELRIASVQELADSIRQERLHDMKGFGEKTEANILHGIELLRQQGGRVPLNVAMDLAEEIIAQLPAVPGCESCAYAGSLRRMRETVGDVDILVAPAQRWRSTPTRTGSTSATRTSCAPSGTARSSP